MKFFFHPRQKKEKKFITPSRQLHDVILISKIVINNGDVSEKGREQKWKRAMDYR